MNSEKRKNQSKKSFAFISEFKCGQDSVNFWSTPKIRQKTLESTENLKKNGEKDHS